MSACLYTKKLHVVNTVNCGLKLYYMLIRCHILKDYIIHILKIATQFKGILSDVQNQSNVYQNKTKLY